jgi:hypothetical protein
MLDGTGERAGTGAWYELLAATQLALTHLRADELEELASLAEQMLRTTQTGESTPGSREQAALLTARQRLLGDLLAATDSNAQVLRRLHERGSIGEGNARWLR